MSVLRKLRNIMVGDQLARTQKCSGTTASGSVIRGHVWRNLLVVMMASTLLLVAGCGQQQSSKDSKVIRYVLEQEPSTLDPAKSQTLPESTVQLQLFEGLTRLDEQGEPQPAAAMSWELSPDGTVYTFHMRPHMKWSNGDVLTAKDFEYAWKRALDHNEDAGTSYMLYPIKNGEAYNSGEAKADDVGVKAVDDSTLVVTLEQPTPYFLKLLAFHAFYPVNEQVAKTHQYWASKGETIVGNGPYKVTEWRHNGYINFAKNENYWDANSVVTDVMNWPISESQSTRLTLVEGGEADMMVEPPVPDQHRLEKEGLLQIGPMLGTYYYVFNVTAEPFTDARVRKAFAMVIDRKAIVDNVVHGGKIPAFAFVPPGMLNPATGKDFRAEGGPLVTENLEAAKALLKEAGYDEHHPLPQVSILYNTNEMHKAIAEAVQATWAKAFGVNVSLQNQESKVFLASREEGRYQVARASWIADFGDPQNFLEVFSASDNDAQFHNDAYNDLINKVRSTQDGSLRNQYMHDAEQMMFDEGLVMPIYYTTQPYVSNGKIKDFYWTALGLIDFKKAYRVE